PVAPATMPARTGRTRIPLSPSQAPALRRRSAEPPPPRRGRYRTAALPGAVSHVTLHRAGCLLIIRPNGRFFGEDPMVTTTRLRKGEATRRLILERAAPVFNQRGYAGASMSELVEATGIEKGGIYNHFGSKEELAVEAFDYAIGLIVEGYAAV